MIQKSGKITVVALCCFANGQRLTAGLFGRRVLAFAIKVQHLRKQKFVSYIITCPWVRWAAGKKGS